MKIRYKLSIASFLFAALAMQAADHTIVTENLTYSPDDLTASVGDNITIVASGNHPTTEVSEDTWNADGTTPLPGGFGTNTSSFTFTVEAPGEIFYVCDSHVGLGMKGKITVVPTSIDEYVNQISVQFGQLPVRDGSLEYSITARENLVQYISVVDVKGQEVIQELVESTEGRLDLNSRAGVYIVLLKDKEGTILFRESISVE